MYITCKDLLALNIFQNCRLLTGDAGINNTISWPVMAKTVLESNWFSGGEFVLIAESYVPFDEDSVLNFLDICSQCNVAGLLIFINTDSDTFSCVTEKIIQKAISLNIPLFESPWEIRSIDIIKKISLCISEDNLRNNALENVLKTTLFFQSSEEEYTRLLNLGLTNTPYHLIRIQLFHFEEYCHNNNYESDYHIHEQKQFVKRTIINHLYNHFPSCPVCSNSNIIILFYKCREDSPQFIQTQLQEVRNQTDKTFPKLDIRFCISQTYSEIHDITAAFHETSHLVSLSNLKPFQNHIITYKSIGIYQLFLSVPKKQLSEKYQSIMKPLLDYDAANNSDLLITLKTYLKNDCNIDETSGSLFIHKNTIRYRLKRIEEVMNCSLKSSETISMLYYCISVEDYLNAL